MLGLHLQFTENHQCKLGCSCYFIYGLIGLHCASLLRQSLSLFRVRVPGHCFHSLSVSAVLHGSHVDDRCQGWHRSPGEPVFGPPGLGPSVDLADAQRAEPDHAFLVDNLRRGLTLSRPLTPSRQGRRRRHRRRRSVVGKIFALLLLKPVSSFHLKSSRKIRHGFMFAIRDKLSHRENLQTLTEQYIHAKTSLTSAYPKLGCFKCCKKFCLFRSTQFSKLI